MKQAFLSFDDFINESYNGVELNNDLSETIPKVFNNGFNLGNGWLRHWCSKNNFSAVCNELDSNFYDILDSTHRWIASYDRAVGKIYTNRTLQQLHESTSSKVTELQKEYTEVTDEMKILSGIYKKDKNSNILSKLKELTKKKKELESKLEDEISLLDDQY